MSAPKRDFGPRPELLWLPVSNLHADSKYQRSMSTTRGLANIQRIADNFKWSLFGAVIVAPSLGREDHYAIIDGQHRVEAARRVDIDLVPCLVVDVTSVMEQARLFVAANKNRVALTALGIFNAMIAASDPVAISVRQACLAAGVEILRYPVQVNQIKVGQTMAVSTITSIHRQKGPEILTGILRVVKRSWTEPGGVRTDRIKAVNSAASIHNIDDVERAIIELTPGRLDEESSNHQTLGVSKAEAMRALIIKHLGGKSEAVDTSALLAKAVKRRCQSCGKVFETRSVSQLTCPEGDCS